MKHRIALCAGLAALGVAGATAAQAQVYVEPPRGYVDPPHGYVEPPSQMIHGGLPPSEILMIVRASGLRPLTQPARRGGQYLVLASDNMGGQLRVVVSAHNGRILNAEPAYDPRFASGPMRPRGMVPIAPPQHAAVEQPRYAPPADLRTPSAPPPPRSARTNSAPQNHRLASTPDAASAAPAPQPRTPLPRPRPTIAAADTAAPAAPEATPSAAAAAAQPPATANAAPAKPETQLVPVAPLE